MILVTGGTGFIGSYVSRALVEKGEEVIIYDFRIDTSLISDILDAVEIVCGDILDMPKLLRTLKNRNVEKMVHAAYMMADASDENPYWGMNVNVLGTNNIFEAARILDLERVVWASSASVYAPAEYYGGQSVTVDEDSSTEGTFVYAACKILNEFSSKFYCNKYGLDIIGLRPTLVYGPGRLRGKSAFGSVLIENPCKGMPARIPYVEDQEFDWMYVRDTADAFVKACFVKKPKHIIFNIGGEVRTLKEAKNYVKELIPDADITFGNNPLGWVSRYDTRRAAEELGFRPCYTLKDGIKEFVNITRRKTI